MQRWFPDRKVWAGGLTAVAAYLLVQLGETQLGLDLAMDQAVTFVGIVTAAVAYFTPPSFDDKVKRVDREIRDWLDANENPAE